MRLGDHLDRMVVTASTQDGAITADLYDRDQVRLRFAPGRYQWLNERDLERQLESLGRVMWSRRMREYYAIVSDLNDTHITAEPLPVNEGQREYVERRDQIVAKGQSSGGRISVSVHGMQHWTVRIEDGTLRQMPEDAFAGAIKEAVKQMLDDQWRQIAQLKLELGERMDATW